MKRPAMIVLAGPTASGKSALALRAAQELDGTIINADSMQLYRDLHVLTARPGPEEERAVPHRLYGVLDPGDPGSAGRWLMLAGAEIERARADGRIPMVVGGTGLYLRALLAGIAPVPEISAVVRAEVRALHERLGGATFHVRLAERDPLIAARIGAGDPQRMMRAMEVLLATGRSLAEWQAMPRLRIALPGPVRAMALVPPRERLNARLEERLRRMVGHGALEEVRRLLERGLDRSLPVMKAVAVPELAAHLRGEVDLETALARATAATRRYAKRQRTWLRHQLPAFERIEAFGDEVDSGALTGGPTASTASFLPEDPDPGPLSGDG